MASTEWTVISTGLVILIAIAGAFGSLRNELINQRQEMTEGYKAPKHTRRLATREESGKAACRILWWLQASQHQTGLRQLPWVQAILTACITLPCRKC